MMLEQIVLAGQKRIQNTMFINPRYFVITLISLKVDAHYFLAFKLLQNSILGRIYVYQIWHNLVLNIFNIHICIKRQRAT